MFCGTGWMITAPPLLVVAMLVFIVGTEIRVRIEDRLLASRFGDRFRGYQHAKCQRTFPFSVGRVEKLR
jgi:protein-S-isoprenylcysteine O-methyltransferase Ste14